MPLVGIAIGIGGTVATGVAALETLRRAADFLVRAKVRERSFDEALEITPREFEELKEKIEANIIDLAASIGGGVVGGAATGAAAAVGAYSTVSFFASASTGAA